MLVKIKEVRACKNKAYGNFICRGQNNILITISLKKNNTAPEYCATVFHELMHLWVTIMRAKGLRCTNIKEHQFIYAAERFTLKMAKKHLRPRR